MGKRQIENRVAVFLSLLLTFQTTGTFFDKGFSHNNRLKNEKTKEGFINDS